MIQFCQYLTTFYSFLIYYNPNAGHNKILLHNVPGIKSRLSNIGKFGEKFPRRTTPDAPFVFETVSTGLKLHSILRVLCCNVTLPPFSIALLSRAHSSFTTSIRRNVRIRAAITFATARPTAFPREKLPGRQNTYRGVGRSKYCLCVRDCAWIRPCELIAYEESTIFTVEGSNYSFGRFASCYVVSAAT